MCRTVVCVQNELEAHPNRSELTARGMASKVDSCLYNHKIISYANKCPPRLHWHWEDSDSDLRKAHLILQKEW